MAHIGVVVLAVGIAGSSLGTQRRSVVLRPGQRVSFAGHQLQFVRLEQRQLPDKLVVEAVVRLLGPRGVVRTLRPAQHRHHLQEQWTTEVDIASTWAGDLYVILNAGWEDGRAELTLVSNPLVVWLWVGGCLTCLAAVVRLWPSRRAGRRAAGSSGAEKPNKPVAGRRAKAA